MSRKLEHTINMQNFIQQIASEHDLIDELVANAVEAANNWVKIIHKFDRIIIWNDGKNLTLREIETTLLTAFETGKEKSLETNRGLGFISLYKNAKYAIINSGELQLQVQSWDDIIVEKGSNIEGFRIEVILADEIKEQYSLVAVKNNLSNWIYWEPIDILFGSDSKNLQIIGNKYSESLNFKHHPKYNYQNLRYILSNLNFSQNVVFLYKLTNVQVYRQLPIDFNIEQRYDENNIEKISFIISHGSYLDSTRRSLTKWGIKQVEYLIGLIQSDLKTDNLRRATFKIKTQFLNIIEEIVENLIPLTLNINLEYIIEKFNKKIINHATIVYHGFYLEKFLQLLSYIDYKGRTSVIYDLYSEFPEFLVSNKPNIEISTFHLWIEEMLNIDSSHLFADVVVGFKLSYGDVSDEITIQSIIKNKLPTITFDNKLFISSVIHRVEMAVILNEETWFFTNLDNYKTDLSSLMAIHGRSKENLDELKNFRLSNDILPNLANLKSEYSGIIENIPYLNYSAKQVDKELEKKIGSLSKYYEIWRSAVKVCLEVFATSTLNNFIPVLVLPESESNLACYIHNFIGVSIHLLEQLNKTSAPIILLYTAIHEVSHIFCRPHSSKFYQISSEIYIALLKSSQLIQYVSSYIHQ